MPEIVLISRRVSGVEGAVEPLGGCVERDLSSACEADRPGFGDIALPFS